MFCLTNIYRVINRNLEGRSEIRMPSVMIYAPVDFFSFASSKPRTDRGSDLFTAVQMYRVLLHYDWSQASKPFCAANVWAMLALEGRGVSNKN